MAISLAGAHKGKRRSRRVKAANSTTTWLQLWSIAIYDFKLTPEQFYSFTPRQLDALIKRKELADRMNEFLFGQLTAAVVNFSMAHPKESLSAQDFMPSEFGKPKPHPKRVRITKKVRDEVTQSVRDGFAALLKR